MTTAINYLAISDGTTIINLVGSGIKNHILAQDGWTPNLPRLQHSKLAGRGSYQEVVEELIIHVTGATAGAAYSNLQTLIRMFDKAELWARGENVNAVVLKYSPKGAIVSSIATPLQSVILGSAGSEVSNSLSLSPKFVQAGKYYIIENVRLRFRRRGLWYLEDSSGNITGQNSGSTNVVFNQTHPVISPMSLSFSALVPAGTINIGNGIVIVNGMGISRQDAYLLTASEFTAVSDATNLPQGSQILRYTPTTTNYKTTGAGNSGGVGAGATSNQIAVFATVRNNSASVTWNIRARFTTGALPLVTTLGTPVLIDASTTNPRVVYLGTVGGPAQNLIDLALDIQASSTAGGPTLDIDQIFPVELMAARHSYVIEVPGFTLGTLGGRAINFNNGILTQLAPNFILTPENYSLSYKGDIFLETGQTIASGPVFATWVTTRSNYWRLVDAAGSLMTMTVTVTRHKCYVSPE